MRECVCECVWGGGGGEWNGWQGMQWLLMTSICRCGCGRGGAFLNYDGIGTYSMIKTIHLASYMYEQISLSPSLGPVSENP